jgi:RNA polymerase sigma-54 factor
MPLLDLQQHIKQEMLNNPFLDLEEPTVPEDEAAAKETQKEKEEQEKEKEKEEIDWEEILLDGFETGGRRAEYEDREFYEPVPVDTRDLYDHLRDQLTLLRLSPR